MKSCIKIDTKSRLFFFCKCSFLYYSPIIFFFSNSCVTFGVLAGGGWGSKTDVNPEFMMCFMSLMTDYVRLYLVVASVSERKQALGMYYLAYFTIHGKKATPAMTKVQCCLN